MFSDKFLTFLVILCLIPGALCKYENSYSRLIAICVVGFFLLVAIITMIMLATLWRDWWERRQMERGRRRVDRGKWTLFHQKTKRSVISTTASQQRQTELVVVQNPAKERVEWDRKLVSGSAGGTEEKSKTIEFGHEDDGPVIVTETAASTPRYDPVRASNSLQQTAANYQTEDGTFYIPVNTEKTYQTDVKPRGQSSYHVKMSEMPGPASKPTRENIFITPMVPSTSAGNAVPVNPTSGKATYVFQDSDDEAGNILNRRDDQVLF